MSHGTRRRGRKDVTQDHTTDAPRPASEGGTESSPDDAIRILLTGAGTGRTNNLIRSLRAGATALDIVGCYHDRFLLAKSGADRSYLAPGPSDDDFVDALRKLILAERIDLMIPNSDGEALAIARIRDQLPCRTFLPATAVIELCQDKYECAQFLAAKGVPVPETYPLGSRDDIAEIFARFGHPPLLWCRTRTGAGSRAATMVKDADQAWNWITYWNEMRDTRTEEFTLSEYLPGRDFNVQCLCDGGRILLIKMIERLSYLDGGNRPSGTSSTPALAKTLRDDEILDLCERAMTALDPSISGVLNIDLKEDQNGCTRITEINAGRFAMITNIYDFTGRHNMAESLVRLAMDKPIEIQLIRDIDPDYYLIREYDSPPDVVPIDELSLYDNI